MSEHIKTVCKQCGILMGQCRCPAKDKTIEYDVCKKCYDKVLNINMPEGAVVCGELWCGDCPYLISMDDMCNYKCSSLDVDLEFYDGPVAECLRLKEMEEE